MWYGSGMVVHKADLNTSDLRRIKAKKIEALLDCSIFGADLLDLGTGSGHLASYFTEQGANVVAADADGYRYAAEAPFYEIKGSELPFPDNSFDIVIFNHVLEHVGNRPAQKQILAQISRVLRPGGTLYLGVPNKWELIETHYKLPFLGALPKGVADFLVRTIRKQPEYDCYPLSDRELHSMVSENFGSVIDRTSDAYNWVIENELSGARKAIFRLLPMPRPIVPSFILLAKP